MAKLIFKDALEEMYGARIAKPKGAMRTAVALYAKSIDIVQQGTEYIVVVQHHEGTSFFKVEEQVLLESDNPITMEDDYTNVFFSYDVMGFTQAREQSIGFATSTTYKKFSKWLFDVNRDIYMVMTEEMCQFIRSARFTINLDITGYNHYMSNCILEYTSMNAYLKPCVVELKKGNPLIEQLAESGKCFILGTDLEPITKETTGMVYVSEQIPLTDGSVADYCCWVEENSNYDHAPLSKYLDIVFGFEVK